MSIIRKGVGMLRTIIMGTCVFVQGNFVKALPDGRIAIRVGSTVYKGQPVTPAG